jgi:C1A family cysteine protease
MGKIQRYGWQPDVPDCRDFQLKVPRHVLRALPPRVDLTATCPPVYDQGDLGSCTANAIGGAFEFDMHSLKLPDFKPSRLQIYYDERVIEHTIKIDAGAQIRDGIKVVAKNGVCPESLWPYIIANFAKKPPPKVYAAALKHKAVTYERVARTESQLCGCLAGGHPFVFGFAVYDGFESDAVAKTGTLNMPKKSESLLGGHAVMAVGYDKNARRFIVRNSWGPKWGKKGYFTMPFAYLLDANLSDDFWAITTVT